MALLSFMARLGLDATGFEKNMAKAGSQVDNFGDKTLGALKGKIAAAFTVATVMEFRRRVIEHADSIGDLAEQYSITTDEAQKLQIVAGKTGVEFDRFGKILLKVAEIRDKALGGGHEGASARAQLGAFGISQSDIESKQVSSLDLATRISVALNGVTDDARALDLVGGRGASALATLRGIADLGPVSLISKEEIDTLSKAKDDFAEIYRLMLLMGAKAEVGIRGAIHEAMNDPYLLGEGLLEMLTGRVTYTGNGDEYGKTGAITKEEMAAYKSKTLGKRTQQSATGQRDSIIAASQFQSSASKSVSSLGGYYLGGDATASMDLARQALELAKRTADSLRNIEENTSTIKSAVDQQTQQ